MKISYITQKVKTMSFTICVCGGGGGGGGVPLSGRRHDIDKKYCERGPLNPNHRPLTFLGSQNIQQLVIWSETVFAILRYE